MKLLVLGASGGTGKHVVMQALAHGHEVTAFVRDPSRLPLRDERLRIFEGNVADAARVAAAVRGQDVVVSTLGVGKPLRHDQDVIDGVRNVIASMKEHGVRRLIYLSTIGIGDGREAAGFMIRYVARIPLRQEFADHEIKEALIRDSGLEWTIVRAPKLTNGVLTGRYRSGTGLKARSPQAMMSRADVAQFLVAQIDDRSYIRSAPRVLP